VEYSSGGFITKLYGAPQRHQAEAGLKQSGPPAARRAGWLHLCGVGTVYNRVHAAYSRDWQQDVFAKGCFEKFIESGRNTTFHRMHQHAKAFGSTSDESLTLFDAAEGLLFKLKVDEADAEAVKLFNDVASRA
jgi:phage head maturation protease